MTNDCSLVEPQPRKGRTFALSLGASFAALAVVVVAILAVGAPTADATVYTMSGGSSAFNWTDVTRWSPSGVPGAGDTAVVNVGTTITVDTNVNGVILSMVSFGTNINIPSGSTLKLEPSSSLNSTNNINVNGGTLAFDTGTTSNGGGVTLNTGTLNLTGNMSVLAGSGSFTWNGGQITGSGTLTNPLLTGLSITGTGGGMTITGATIDNFGSINYSSATGQSLSVNSGAHIKIESAGSFLLIGSDPIQSDLTATPSIDVLSGGSLSKGGITTSQVGVPVNNAGTVSAGAGTLYLSEGGTHTGQFSLLASTGVLKFNSSVTPHTFNAGSSVQGGSIGLAQIIGGNFNVNTTSGSPIVFPKLDQLGGTVGSTGYLKVSGTFNWTGGTQNGAGTTEIASGAIANLNGSSAITLDTSRLFLNNGTLNYAPTSSVLSINNGAKISNNSIIDLQNDSSINSTTPASSSIDNASTAILKKSAGVSTAIACVVNLSGTSSIAPNAGGTIAMGAGGSWGGAPVTINLSAAGSVVQLAGGTFSLNSSVTALGSGRIDVLGNMALNTPLGISNFELDNGGSVITVAAGLLTINGTLFWNGGAFTGPGAITLANTATGNLTALTGPPALANGITFTNNGGISYNPTQSLTFTNSGGGGATFNNSATGTFDIQGNGTTTSSGAGNSFNVLGGTVKKSAGAGVFLFTIPYNQSGGLTDVPFASALIGITGGGSFTNGTMQAVAAGSEIAFNSTPAYTVNGGTFSGTVALKGGTLTAAGPVSAPVTFNQIAGTLNGASTLTIPNASTYTMTGGALTPSLVNISSGGQLTLDSTTNSLTLGATTNNGGGNILWSAGSNFINCTGASGITNIGVMDLRGSGTFGSAVSGTLNTTGTLKKTVNAGTITMAMPVTLTSGTLSVQAGTLRLANPAIVTHGGSFDVQAGTTLSFDNGNHILGIGSVFSAGTGNVVINSPAILTLNTGLAIPTVTLNGGQLTGSGLSTTNSFSWNGGTMDGAGTTTITTGTFTLTTGPMTLGRNLTIPGNTTVTLGSNALNLVSAVNIINGGTFDIHSGTIACVACGASFVNNGTLQASAPGNATVAVPVTGTGNLVVNGATFNGQAGEAFNTATIDNGAANLTGNPINIGSVSNGGTFPGVISIMGGATTIAGAVNLGAANGTIAVYAGTLTLNGATSVVNFALNAGTVNGSGNVTAGSSFVFNAGALGGSGLFTSSGTGTLSGSGGAMTLSRSLTNDGAMIYTPALPSNILTAGASVVITNNGTFDFTNENFAASASPIAQFVNGATGTFRRIAGNTGTLNFDPAVFNAGTTLFSLGTTNFTNGFAQFAGTTTLSGGNVSSPGNIAINGGVLNAYGTISGFLKNNGGTVNVQNGVSPATLAINGAYLQSALGLLNLKLNGPATPGTTYSQLNVSNTVSLAGTLAGSVGYAPVNGDVFLPLTFGSNPGGTDFSTKTFTPLAPGVTFNTAYIAGPPQALQITVSTSTADLSLTQAAQPTAIVGQNVPVTLTVTNNGPAAVTATITDTFTGGVFISATPSAGGNCAGTGPVTCTFTGMANAATGTVTLVLGANLAGTITNNAAVSAGATFDPNLTNNTPAPVNTVVTTSADLSVTKTGNNPGLGGNVIYTVTVTNHGPSTATGITLADITPAGLTFVSATGACTSFPCAIASLTNGSSAQVIATYSMNNPGAQILFNTATVSALTLDPNLANNSATATTNIGCLTAPVTTLPGNNTTGLPFNGTLFWNGNAGQFKVYFGPAGSGCQTLLGTSNTNSIAYANLQPATQYEWRVEGIAAACPTLSSACATFTTAPSCAQPPAPTAPASGATLNSPIVFNWIGVPGASDYHLFASVNGSSSLDLGTTTGNSLTLSIGDGAVVWYVVANVPGCGQLQSPSSTFNACNDLPAPIAAIVANAASGQSYDVTWDAIPGATNYEVSEASNANFTGATTKTVITASASFQHTVSVGTALFYRVRAFGGCKQQFSGYSNTARVVLLPVVASSPGQNPSANVPVGSTLEVVQTVFIPGFPDGTFQYAATVDQPWLSVQPSTGALPPSGVTLQVVGDPTDLPNGTFTGTVIVTISSGSGARATANATTTVSVPISINLVTPVKPGNSATPPANALIIPSVGHLDGLNSKWQSDVRLANPTATKQSYALTFTPDDPTLGVKTTTITVASNDTTALDDIVRNWYGVGDLGESANGVLLIVPSSGNAGTSIGGLVPEGTVPNVSVQTVAVASSRTYNVTSTGTLGQFIPAIPFASFIDKNAAALSLQQVAQNDAFRTNLGLVEGSGSPATVLLSVFSSAGGKLLEQSVDLKPNEQKQLNSFLAANGVTIADGRVEVKVTSSTGKVTAYASVVDNKTGDPLLVSGVPVTAAANHFVLPGVAALNNGIANWRSDVRIYNGGTSPQAATLTLYPLNSTSAPLANAIVLNPGEVRGLDDIVKSYFSLDNTGGSLHVTTSGASPLVVSGRTYNLTTNGTYGQFISAVTPDDGVGKGDRPLNVLQVEDSVRYRTNLGLAELTGNPATVEVSVFLPDSKVIPKVQFSLQANEYRQTAILRDLGLSNIYNARISVRVIDGAGKVTAYGSVIDIQTQDPTYVPAQ
jgi:uncharacterized repeat protein (TIGR01451 family)